MKTGLIDGFAGGNLYVNERTKEERPGSPGIMLDAMRSAEKAAQQSRKKEFKLDVHYLFIEKNPEYYEHLKHTLQNSAFCNLLADRITLIRDEFVAQVENIIDFIRQRQRHPHRSIFVLDQCGYRDVPMPAIRKILADLAGAEVILTFATDFLIDYLSDNDQTQAILDKVGLSISRRTIQSSKTHRDWRRAIQFILHREIHDRSGARFYTPFFIRSKHSHRDFWMIHLSGHHRARDVMVGLHWEENTSFAHYGGSGLKMLGCDPDEDFSITSQMLLPGFYFDESAHDSTHESLLEQLPERLFDKPQDVSFNELFAELTDESPATSQIMQEVIADLAREGVLQIRDKTLTTKGL